MVNTNIRAKEYGPEPPRNNKFPSWAVGAHAAVPYAAAVVVVVTDIFVDGGCC